MAYTTQQLVDFYTNANLGKAPDAATRLTIDALATQTQPGGDKSEAEAKAATLKLVDSTTAVAVASYQFFTGAAPSAAGLDYLVDSTTNANDLNDANGVYAKFSQENRFINFAINLGTGAGAGAAQFTTDYGTGVTYAQVVASAYNKVIGNAAAAAAGVDVSAAVAYLSRQANIDFLTNYVRSNGVTGTANIELAVKAALVGQVLNVAVVSGIGIYANATKALIDDLSDGTLSTDTPAGVNIIAAYPGAGAVGTTYTLKTGADTIVGTNANDVFNALTINADGTGATTFSAFDSIDGGGGVDTLNIYTDDTGVDPFNMSLPSSVTIKNVEIVNILNAGSAAALADASKFQGIQQLWQVNAAAAVTGLATGVTAGFRGIAGGAGVTTNATAISASIALDNQAEGQTFTVDSATGNTTLATVNLSGTVADTDADGTVADTTLAFTAGKNVGTVNVNTSVATTLTVAQVGGSTTDVTSVNLAGSTGAVTYAAAATVRTITGGAGKDTLTITTATVADNTATAADETVTATVNAGAGNDTINVNVTGDGLVVVDAGAGNDTVNILGRGTAKLNINLGDGSDKFTSAVAINATDIIDAGAGVDTLALSLVGSANVGAFRNFDVFDVAGMTGALDLDILATNNTVTELVGSAAVTGTVTLSNVGTGVNYRATGTQATGTVALTQKTAGALTVTLDADQTGTENTADDVRSTTVSATNATTVTAAFETSYLNVAGSKTGETAATDNVSTINLSTGAATAITVTSGGTNAQNVINIADASTGTNGKLATVTVTGAQHLTLGTYSFAATNNSLTTIDASAATGGLTASLAVLKNEGTIRLGAGTDVITATAASNATGIESLQGFAKAAAVSIATTASPEKTAAIAAADKIVVEVGVGVNEAVANANGAATGATLADGVLTFTGAGPTTLAGAIAIADAFANTVGETVVFQYLNDSYVFSQGVTHTNGGTEAVTAADVVVKLTGVTGVTHLVETGTDTFFIV
jgi:hypothetical protein